MLSLPHSPSKQIDWYSAAVGVHESLAGDLSAIGFRFIYIYYDVAERSPERVRDEFVCLMDCEAATRFWPHGDKFPRQIEGNTRQ